MKFKSVREAVAWAYEYLDCSRSAGSPNLDPEKYFTPAKQAPHGDVHGDRLLAIRILDYLGGYVEPDTANHSLLAYFVGWVRWRALTGKERVRVRGVTAKLREYLEGEGVLEKKEPLSARGDRRQG